MPILNFKLEPSVRKRMLRAFLDLLMIRILTQHSMSSYEINKTLTKKYHVMIGPSTIYSKLSTLEEQGSIQSDKGRSGKVYRLTDQGKQIASNMPFFIEEICENTKAMLNSKIVPYKKEKVD